MIRATFFRSNAKRNGFSLSGHAEYADEGKDIVCASVTSAMQMAANGITEILHHPATVDVLENEVRLKLSHSDKQAEAFLDALYLQLSLLAEDYPETIQLSDLEV